MGTLNVPDHGFDKDKNIVEMTDTSSMESDISDLRDEISLLKRSINNLKNSCPIPVGGVYVAANASNPISIWSGTNWIRIGGGKYILGCDPSSSDPSYRTPLNAAGGPASHWIQLSDDQIPRHRHFITFPQTGVPSGGSDLPSDKRIYTDFISSASVDDPFHYIWQSQYGYTAGDEYSGKLIAHQSAGQVTDGGALRTEFTGPTTTQPIEFDNRPPAIVLAFWRRTT